MNFESIKLNFLNYLNEKFEKDGIEQQEIEDSLSDISIFMYGSEFKDYLVEEVGADVSIFSKSLSEIMSMDFVNGKFVDPTDEPLDNEDDEYDTSNFMTDALNDLFSDENFINSYDVDKSGELSREEVNSFLESIAQADNDMLSFDGLVEAAGNIQGTKESQPIQLASAEIPTEEEQNETKTVQPIEETKENKSAVDELLEKGYNFAPVIKALDEDGDGELSDEEKAKFEEFVKENYGDSGELQYKDLQKAFSDIIDDRFSYDKTKDEIQEAEKTLKDEVKKEAEKANEERQTAASQSSGGGGYVNGGGGGGGTTSATTAAKKKTSDDTKDKALEELEEEKKAKEGEVQDARDAVNDVYSGENDAVKSAEEEKEQTEEDYKEAVENDENIEEETKKELAENLDSIADQEKVIDGVKSDIQDKENQISDTKIEIAADESSISALETSLAALDSQKTDDPEEQAAIDEKKAEIQKQLDDAKIKLGKDQDKLKEAENQKTELENNLKTEEGVLAELETAKADIEDKILENCSDETKDLMTKFNAARDNVNEVKEKELATTQENLKTLESELEDINVQIDEKKAEQIEKENSVNTGGQEVLENLEKAGGDAWNDFDTLCSTLGLNREETAAHIANLCEAEEWGNGCIDPVLFLAQLRQESGYSGDAVGDGGRAVGLGQLWPIAVEEVNRYHKTSYSADDRYDPYKNLEITMLFLRECYEATGDTDGMLGMYNQGTAAKAYSSDGKYYVQCVRNRLANYS